MAMPRGVESAKMAPITAYDQLEMAACAGEKASFNVIYAARRRQAGFGTAANTWQAG